MHFSSSFFSSLSLSPSLRFTYFLLHFIKHRLRECENRVQRITFVPKRGRGSGGRMEKTA
jgi:hypothetical protein